MLQLIRDTKYEYQYPVVWRLTGIVNSTNPVRHSWVSGLTQQAIAQLTGDPRYLRFNVLIREDAKG